MSVKSCLSKQELLTQAFRFCQVLTVSIAIEGFNIIQGTSSACTHFTSHSPQQIPSGLPPSRHRGNLSGACALCDILAGICWYVWTVKYVGECFSWAGISHFCVVSSLWHRLAVVSISMDHKIQWVQCLGMGNNYIREMGMGWVFQMELINW